MYGREEPIDMPGQWFPAARAGSRSRVAVTAMMGDLRGIDNSVNDHVSLESLEVILARMCGPPPPFRLFVRLVFTSP